MSITLMLIPASDKVNLTNISLGLAKAFSNCNFKVNYFEPIFQSARNKKAGIGISECINIKYAEHLLISGNINELLENIIASYEKLSSADITIIKGLSYRASHAYISKLNKQIANALNAKIIIVTKKKNNHMILQNQLLSTAVDYPRKVLGYVINGIDYKPDFIPSSIEYISHIPKKKRPGVIKKAIINFIANQFDQHWLKTVKNLDIKFWLSPPLFRYRLIKRAQSAKKRIILPEATDIRVIQAAMACTRRKIARCILLGLPEEIHQVANEHGIELSKEIEIIEPTEELIGRYVKPMVELRKNKGLTAAGAYESLQDKVVLATMMLHNNDIDGVVSGAVHTTANTIRPALQLIKTRPRANLVSSLFFMCLPEQVLVYADCAINTNPDSKELADIAIQSADSAALFGIEPIVAMMSYSTGSSGFGQDVNVVRKAVEIVKEMRPDLIVDGPLQYDAAVSPKVAKQKAPDSPVAGKASVFIFPDLNTGNIVYKAVQRSTDTISIGPVLQGLNKPVNDLSRGCSVEDIIYTVALTAVQADQF